MINGINKAYPINFNFKKRKSDSQCICKLNKGICDCNEKTNKKNNQ